MRFDRWRFFAIYFACWVPYAVIFGLVLLVQRPGTPIESVIVAAALEVLGASLLGLVVRELMRRIHRSELARARTVVLLVAVVIAYGASDTALTILTIRLGAPADVYGQYMANAVGWDVIGGLTIGALLVAIFTMLEMNERLRQQRALAVRAEGLRVRAELAALRAQLDPHFLFNTLHSITTLVRLDPALAERALVRFGSLMRYVLESAGDREGEVPLDEELDFVRSFVALEQLRLGDRLRVEEAVEDEALECGIPALTLQPLVENAIRHAIAPRASGGTLRVAAVVDGETLVVTVADDGPGGVPSGGVPPGAGPGGGIGLRTVQQRLLARYGAAGRCEVVSAPNEGWTVHVRIPARPATVRRPSAESASAALAGSAAGASA
jgi:two-component system, LytTR family, sensor kinase